MKFFLVIALLVASALASPEEVIKKHCDSPIKDKEPNSPYSHLGCNLECTDYFEMLNQRLFTGLLCTVNIEKACQSGNCKALPAETTNRNSLYLSKVNMEHKFEYRYGKDKIYLCIEEASAIKSVNSLPVVNRSRCVTCDYANWTSEHEIYCQNLQQYPYDQQADVVVLEKWIGQEENKHILAVSTLYQQFPHIAFNVSSIKFVDEFNGTLPLHSHIFLTDKHYSNDF